MHTSVKIQSAMEYLMTYGWAILIIAVVLGALYQLGIFGSSSLGVSSSCFPSVGFLCQSPILNASGSLAVRFGQIGLGTITITGTACTTNVSSPSSTQSANVVLTSGQSAVLSFSCPLSSNSLGTGFKGYIWITYSTQSQSGMVGRVAVVQSKVSTLGSSATALGGNSTSSYSPTYVYCIGGFNSPGGTYSQAYYATILSNGLSAWTSTTSYPTTIRLHSCASYSGYLYCVTGYTGGAVINNVYYAPISSNGIGTWTATTAYPFANYYNKCVTYAGYIYCVGGYTSGPINNVYSAPVSSSGVGSWTSTTSYPTIVYDHECVTTGGYIYCVGGGNPSSNNVYYASLSSGMVGTWTATTSYPIVLDSADCATGGGYIYCLGGNGAISTVYYAPISGSGIGTWVAANSYPLTILEDPAVFSNGQLFSITSTGGGYSNLIYYSPIVGGIVGTWTTTNSYPLAPYTQTCSLYG